MIDVMQADLQDNIGKSGE